VLAEWGERHPGERLLVWASGGRDSAAVLALAVDALGPERVVPVFRYLVEGLRCVELPIRAQLARLGIRARLVTVPGFDALNLLRNGEYTWWQCSGAERKVQWRDVYEHALRKTGCAWSASGEKKADSLMRRMRLTNGGVHEKQRKLYPVWDWSHARVAALVRTRKLPLAPTFGRESQGGVGLKAEVLRELKERYPEDYARVEAAFPFCGAVVARQEMFG